MTGSDLLAVLKMFYTTKTQTKNNNPTSDTMGAHVLDKMATVVNVTQFVEEAIISRQQFLGLLGFPNSARCVLCKQARAVVSVVELRKCCLKLVDEVRGGERAI